MEALRAHAHSASSNIPGHHNEPVHVDIEPDPEPEIPSPTHIPRGPSPEAKPDDTECHRSQSAMYVNIFLVKYRKLRLMVQLIDSISDLFDDVTGETTIHVRVLI